MNINELISHWKPISSIIREPKNKEEYDQLARILDQLLDIVGQDESHDLMGLIDIISNMISSYDDAHIEPLISDKGRNTLDGLNSLPSTPDDFFPDSRTDRKPQDRTDNE